MYGSVVPAVGVVEPNIAGVFLPPKKLATC